MKKPFLIVLIGIILLSGGCADTTSRARSVFLLLDTSGTYKAEIDKARAIISYLLGTFEPGDSLAVARIDSGSFSEKDIIAKVTFDRRPSVATRQKRLFRDKIDRFIVQSKGSAHTDITGGVVQAVQYLNETGAGHKYILLFSDLKEDLVKGHIRNFPLEMKGCQTIALNVTKLRSDNIDPRQYFRPGSKRIQYPLRFNSRAMKINSWKGS
ncbi:MAG: hypothetical protein JJV98_20185 [Desulfosarcina sp.]|nr:hypothetical protein [Desulfobacterales bacterium]